MEQELCETTMHPMEACHKIRASKEMKIVLRTSAHDDEDIYAKFEADPTRNVEVVRSRHFV